MSQFRPDSQMHRARLSRNLGLGAVLAGFVVLVFALTVVKVTRGDPMQGFDHQPRSEMVPAPVVKP
jgi:hypothetical protein